MDLTKPILITGASGKTGRRAVAATAEKGGMVRAFLRRPEAGPELLQAGASEIAIGDLSDPSSLQRALEGVGQVLHICPPMHPQEDKIAMSLIDLASREGVDRFVLYSVLHPLLADVPHHARKLEAERYLVDSGQVYTILQPGRYMQHLAAIWKTVLTTGVHSMPFGTKARFSVVDLTDLADATANVLTSPGHDGATYQLAGPGGAEPGRHGVHPHAGARPADPRRRETARRISPRGFRGGNAGRAGRNHVSDECALRCARPDRESQRASLDSGP